MTRTTVTLGRYTARHAYRDADADVDVVTYTGPGIRAAHVVRRMRAALALERLAGYRHVATWSTDGMRVHLLVPRGVA
jgi:hypothetical protein